jgi:N-methylhydantoinase B
MLGNSTFTQRGGKQLSPAAGRAGGHPSALARITVNPGKPELEKVLSAADGNVSLRPGDVLRFQQSGAGGYGDPRERSIEEVLRDVQNGYVSPQAAHDLYCVGVVQSGHSWVLDEMETARLRAGGVPRGGSSNARR